MQQNTFQDLAQVTKSDKFFGENVPRAEFMARICAAANALVSLDVLKKALFYGRDFPMPANGVWLNSKDTVRDWMQPVEPGATAVKPVPTEVATDVIHCILGMATEAGELLELLIKTLDTGRFDPVNFAEEIFDSQWYEAIGCTATGMTFEQGQEMIIAKLKLRFGEKFSAYYANNRDLFAERKVLEVGVSSPINETK